MSRSQIARHHGGENEAETPVKIRNDARVVFPGFRKSLFLPSENKIIFFYNSYISLQVCGTLLPSMVCHIRRWPPPRRVTPTLTCWAPTSWPRGKFRKFEPYRFPVLFPVSVLPPRFTLVSFLFLFLSFKASPAGLLPAWISIQPTHYLK